MIINEREFLSITYSICFQHMKWKWRERDLNQHIPKHETKSSFFTFYVLKTMLNFTLNCHPLSINEILSKEIIVKLNKFVFFFLAKLLMINIDFS